MFLLKAIHENICRGWCAYCTHGTVFYIFEDIFVIFDCIDKAYLKKADFCIYHAIYYIFVYSAQYNCRAKYMHTGWNKTNTSKLLLVSCFHIHPAYTITLTRYTHIITTKFKLLSHFLTPISTVLVNIAVNQYDATLNIIIWRFSRGIYFDGDIWK